LEGDATLFVLARLSGGVVGKIRTVAEDCPLDAGNRTVYWLTGVTSTDSLAWLGSFVDGDTAAARNAMAAIAMHGDPEATTRLIAMARGHASSRVRREALFWLAGRAGEKAASTITDAIVNDPETDVKKRAVFALSLLPKDEGVPRLIQVVRTNRNPEVLKQAIFWLGQSNDPRAVQLFEEILKVK
jgi:HEAT repeat protein